MTEAGNEDVLPVQTRCIATKIITTGAELVFIWSKIRRIRAKSRFKTVLTLIRF